jgi:hypothetical protein
VLAPRRSISALVEPGTEPTPVLGVLVVHPHLNSESDHRV